MKFEDLKVGVVYEDTKCKEEVELFYFNKKRVVLKPITGMEPYIPYSKMDEESDSSVKEGYFGFYVNTFLEHFNIKS